MADPHPVTGQLFESPVSPGAGWPEDPATVRTPVARSRDDVARLSAAARTACELDAVIIRREAGGADGEVLGLDPLGWRVTEEDVVAPDRPIPLVTLGPHCGVRSMAVRHLEAAHRPWREAFVGGSCSALVAAVRAGLGIAPMGAVASGRMGDVGPRYDLPALPPSEIVMFARAHSPAAAAAARALEAAVQSMLRGA